MVSNRVHQINNLVEHLIIIHGMIFGGDPYVKGKTISKSRYYGVMHMGSKGI